MKTGNLKKYLDCVEKYKESRLVELDEYYLDQSEWKEVSEDPMLAAVFFESAVSEVIRCILLYDFEIDAKSEELLSIDRSLVSLNKPDLSGWDNSILQRYFYKQAAFCLFMSRPSSLVNELMAESLSFNDLSLRAYGFDSEEKAIFDTGTDSETACSLAVSSILLKMFLNLSYKEVLEAINQKSDSSEGIWRQSLHFLNAIAGSDIEKINMKYFSVIKEWRQCELNSNTHSFSNSHLVILSALYARKLDTPFSVQQVGRYIRGCMK